MLDHEERFLFREEILNLANALGDPGAQRDDALLLELEDRAKVHLRGVDEVCHAAPATRSPARTRPCHCGPSATG